MKRKAVKSTSLIGVVGAGVMGAALTRALLDTGLAKTGRVWATTRTAQRSEEVQDSLGINCTTRIPTALLRRTEMLFLCVKPMHAREVLRELAKSGLQPSTTVVSIVTGLTIEEMQRCIGRSQPVARVITNTPLLVHEACTAIAFSGGIAVTHSRFIQALFSQLGMVQEVDEALCDVLTGLSASGPAYLYLIMEALADGGVRMGLSRETALRVTAQMVRGAATMVQQSGRHPASLRDDVTTPSGCTIAGLFVMEDGKMRSTLARAVEESTKTARMLGQGQKN